MFTEAETEIEAEIEIEAETEESCNEEWKRIYGTDKAGGSIALPQN